jgi:polyisoprenyl-phosphate glycosyltransferase
MSERKLISIVTPCYNEGKRIEQCCNSVRDIFLKNLSDYDYEHIICDNNSDDFDYQIIRNLAEEDSRIKVIRNARNFGIFANTYNGVFATSGDAVLLFLPVDLQDPPELIPEFVSRWESGYDIVYGQRDERMESFILKNLRFIFYKLLSMTSEFPFPKNVGDFQLVDRRIIDEIKKLKDRRPFLRMMPFKIGGKSIGISYVWRNAGRPSKNGLMKMLAQALEGLTSYSTVPLRAALLIGALMSSASLLYALYSLVAVTLYPETTISGIKSLVVGTFLLGGVNLMFLGIIGEYLLNLVKMGQAAEIVYEVERINFD